MKSSNVVRKNFKAPSKFGSEVGLSFRDPKDEFLLVVDFKQDVDPAAWMAEHKDLLQEMMIKHGVVYLNGLNLPRPNVTTAVASILDEDSLVDSYSGGVTKRPRVEKDLFLTTNIPGSGAIVLHHEMSYVDTFPKKVFFYCRIPSEHGGATPVTYSRTVKKKLNPKLFDQFKKRGIAYVRNYVAKTDPTLQYFLSWQEVFEVSTKQELEAKAKSLGMTFEWHGDRLRTKNVRAATIVHPQTNEEFLFNHCMVFQASSEEGGLPLQRAASTSATEDERRMWKELHAFERPMSVAWGDTGELIESAVIEEVFACYNSNKHTVDWRPGNLMMIDNILAAHGRDQFIGRREVLAMLSKK